MKSQSLSFFFFSLILFLKTQDLKRELHSSLHDNSLSVNAFLCVCVCVVQLRWGSYSVKSHWKSADAFVFTATVYIPFGKWKQQCRKQGLDICNIHLRGQSLWISTMMRNYEGGQRNRSVWGLIKGRIGDNK